MRSILVALLVAAAPASAVAETPASFKLSVSDSGVYAVTYGQLEERGLSGPVPSSSLGMESHGEPWPIWVEDGGDGELGPGDSIVFVGRKLAGEKTWNHPWARDNVYFLRTDATRPVRGREIDSPDPGREIPGGHRYLGGYHAERDRLMLRFTGESEAGGTETWYWARIAHVDEKPFKLELPSAAVARYSEDPVTFRLRFRGWSKPHRKDPNLSDHRVEILLNGAEIGAGEWDGDDELVLELVVDQRRVRSLNDLEIRVPERLRTASGDAEPETLIDVVVLDWVEVSFSRHTGVPDTQTRIGWPRPGLDHAVVVSDADDIRLYRTDGVRMHPATGIDQRRFRHVYAMPPTDDPDLELFAVPPGSLREVEAIELARRLELTGSHHRADYLMIAHSRLIDAVRPLAELHRRRGLEVMVVDVAEIYDELSHGIVDPQAIRRFLEVASTRWRKPAPRYVLLVGDASWDTKNEDPELARYAAWTFRPAHGTGVPENQSAPYLGGTDLPHRNLVPTMSWGSGQGHAASDNLFVDMEGDDGIPEMAIGRLPVAEPEEVEAIVAKIRAYVDHAASGDWRRRLLWISSGDRRRDQISDELAAAISPRGFAATKLKPDPEEAVAEDYQAQLVAAIDEGHLAVHFTGHGGRFIWRTAPADFAEQHDLFTLDDLDALRPTATLPIVLSMSCYSAPFDHPTADSIGEKFLRLPGKGAIAVIAASWRNGASQGMSAALVEALIEGGAIGDAFVRAKSSLADPTFRHQYNLLGDPAMPIAVPPVPIELELAGSDALSVRARPHASLVPGTGTVEWADANGDVLWFTTATMSNGRIDAAWDGPPEAVGLVRSVRLYVESDDRAASGVGGLSIDRPVVGQDEDRLAIR